MTQTLVPGQNCPVPASLLSVSIRAGAAADFSAFRLFAGGKTRRDEDFVFYGQKRNDDGTISLSHDACSGVFSVDLARLAPDVEKVALAVTSDFHRRAPVVPDAGGRAGGGVPAALFGRGGAS